MIENDLASNSDTEKNPHCRIFKSRLLRLRKIDQNIYFFSVCMSPLKYSEFKIKLARVMCHRNKNEFEWKKSLESQDFFYVSFLNCNQRKCCMPPFDECCTYCRKKMHCKALEKCPQLIQKFLDRILFLRYSILKNTDDFQPWLLLSSIIFWRAVQCVHCFLLFLLSCFCG